MNPAAFVSEKIIITKVLKYALMDIMGFHFLGI